MKDGWEFPDTKGAGTSVPLILWMELDREWCKKYGSKKDATRIGGF
jgi:hypothetical protein